MSAVLRVAGLTKAYGRFRALDGVAFEMLKSDVLAVIGPNGAGKSTCFNLIGGQLRPDAGTVHLEGRDITGLAPARICRLGLGRTFQIPASFGSFSVLENVQLAMIAAAGELHRLWTRASGLHRDAARALLERVDMADQAARPCGLLAYGDLKRVELAIALAQSPRLLLMDEPTAGMAPAERTDFMESCVKLALQGGSAVLFTEHDMDVVFKHAGRVLVLDRGQVIAEGSPAEVADNDEVREVYLGHDFTQLVV
jgi:branched-chain amino acid transport system ATP-binding protein